jgi:hypothetical protein
MMMKGFLRVLGVILVCLIMLLVVLRITGFAPHDRVPGLWLKGNVVTWPVSDWSFTENIPVIQIQTQTPYLLPHSVNINCLDYNGELYLVSVYPAGTRHSWNENVMRDPHVRLKIGDQIYERSVSLVTDRAVQEGVLEARHKKYPELKIRPNSTIHVFHVVG